jgi:leucyl/phenylalanyl-tRNA--protein transferase
MNQGEPGNLDDSRWAFPDPRDAGADDVVAVGADLEPDTLLAAYRRGLFPMNLPNGGPLAWWSPQQRGILAVDRLRVSRSLRRSMRRFDVTVDRAFAEVVASCANPNRDHGWITPDIAAAYTALHRRGFAHSIEVWRAGELVGGLYGVSIGGLFAGESMFHVVSDASKVALVRLVEIMSTIDAPLIDVQWMTDHLASLGAIEVSREEYLARLASTIAASVPAALVGRLR